MSAYSRLYQVVKIKKLIREENSGALHEFRRARIGAVRSLWGRGLCPTVGIISKLLLGLILVILLKEQYIFKVPASKGFVRRSCHTSLTVDVPNLCQSYLPTSRFPWAMCSQYSVPFLRETVRRVKNDLASARYIYFWLLSNEGPHCLTYTMICAPW